MSLDPTSYEVGRNDALLEIIRKERELEIIADHPMAGYAIDVLETLYQRIEVLSLSTCRVCGDAIRIAELCEACTKGNDPFVTSKYGDGARGNA